jgi:hypothetical protein
MSVRIYGKDYGGEKYREIVEYTNSLFPGEAGTSGQRFGSQPGRRLLLCGVAEWEMTTKMRFQTLLLAAAILVTD